MKSDKHNGYSARKPKCVGVRASVCVCMCVCVCVCVCVGGGGWWISYASPAFIELHINPREKRKTDVGMSLSHAKNKRECIAHLRQECHKSKLGIF